MTPDPADLRRQLLSSQPVTPALREAYQAQLDALLQHKLTPQSRAKMVFLLMAALAFTALGLHTMIYYYPGPFLYAIWALFTGTCALSALWILLTLWRDRLAWKSYFPIADLFAVAATIITVLTLLAGLRAPSDPASTFTALYAIVFLIVSIAWSLHNRIASAELAAREQMLRIECRLAHLAIAPRN